MKKARAGTRAESEEPMALSLARFTPMMKHPNPEFHMDADYRASIERAKAANQRERADALARVPELADLLRVEIKPLPPSTLPLAQRIACADYVDEGVERFGTLAMVRALCAVMAANSIDTSKTTLDELAQGSEEQ